MIDSGSYADDNTPYVIRENTTEVIEALESSFKELMQWFSNNQVKTNADKYQLLTSSNEESSIYIDNNILKLLDVKIDRMLNFNAHSNDICKTVGQKLSALSRITPYMDIAKRRLLLNSFYMP